MKRLALLAVVALSSCKTSIDFDQGRPYSCTPDAGDDEQMCGVGWRCGLEGKCHAIGDAKPYACRVHEDCETNWKCGKDNLCHDLTVLAAYPCDRDEQCTKPWRCGYSGVCLDANAELSASTPTSPTDLTVLGPRFFTGQPEALVASDGVDHYAIAVESQVRFIARSGPGRFTVTDFPDAGTGSGLLVDPDGAYLVDGFGLRSFRTSGMDGTIVPGGAGSWFVGGTRLGPFVMDRGLVSLVGSTSSPLTTVPMNATNVAYGNCIYAVDQSGLWVQLAGSLASAFPLSVSAWKNQTCTQQERVIIDPLLRLGGRTRTVLGLAGDSISGAPPILPVPRNFVSAIDVTRLSQPALSSDPAGTGECTLPPPSRFECAPARVTELLHCEVPCDVGDVLTDLRPGDQAIDVECTGPLGQTTWSMRYDGECAAAALSGSSSRYRETRVPGEGSLYASHLVQRGPHGQLWAGDDVTRSEPLVLDEPATGVLRPKLADGSVSPAMVVATRHSTVLDERLGLVTIGSPETLAYVHGSDDLAVLKGGNVSELAVDHTGTLQVARRRAALDLFPDELRPPVTATLATRGGSGGTSVLLVAVNEGLYAADEASWDRKVPLRLVPQPGFPVLSLALMPGAEVNGFLNTRVGVFRFTSSSELAWDVWPIGVPSGQLIETWADQGRARVGYADGRVLTLPSGVSLTAADAREEIVDYLGLCGQIFALGRKRAVLRLDETGHWVEVPLPGAEVVLGDTLVGGRMLEKDGTIYVFNGSGGGLTFKLSTGCP